MCFQLRRRRRDGGAKRTPTLRSFRNHNKESLSAIKDLIGVATIFSPTKDGFHKPPIQVTDFDEPIEPPSPPITDYMGHSLAVLKKFEAIYDELRGRRLRLTQQALAEFLTKTQREADVLALRQTRYNFGEFLEIMLVEYPCSAVRRPLLETKDLSKPITNYFINSSHNTYISGNQLMSRGSVETYKMVLLRGCRCIEIDVWNGDTPLVTAPDSPRPDHKRGVSGGSLPNAAASVIDAVGDRVESARQMLGDRSPRSTHSRSPSSNSRLGGGSPRESATNLGPKESGDKRDSPRNRSRSRNSYTRSEPIVTHGWTFTTPCGFRDVCKAIKESAFVNNELPIIVSLEVHADQEQQEVMVRIMKEEWGDMLLDQANEGCDPRFRLPKLEELKNKILIKVKKALPRTEIPSSTTTLSPVFSLDEDASGSEDDRSPRSPQSPAGPRGKKVAICQSLSSLAIYTHSEHFKCFDTPAAKKPSHIFSISEGRILDLYQAKAAEIFTHNKNYFMRAFPDGKRVTSTNPDPSLFWRKGVQMVAMNWQYLDEGMMLNEGMFADEQGWVLKPEGYRSCDKGLVSHVEAIPQRTLDLRITVLAGQYISGSGTEEEPDRTRGGKDLRPVVKCELHVEKRDDRRGEKTEDGGVPREVGYKLKTRGAQTDFPDWGERGCTLSFDGIPRVVEELSFLRFRIEDGSTLRRGALLSWACIRLDRLCHGYRFVSLLDSRRNPIPGGKLLVKIDKVLR